MVLDFVLKRDGAYWEASCQRFEAKAYSMDKNNALADLFVTVLLEIALLAQDRAISAPVPLEFRVLDAQQR